MKYVVVVDGSSSSEGAGIGVQILNEDGQSLIEVAERTPMISSTDAEWLAVMRGLQIVEGLFGSDGDISVVVYTDLESLAKSLTKMVRPRLSVLNPYSQSAYDEILKWISSRSDVRLSIEYRSRANQKHADSLARSAAKHELLATFFAEFEPVCTCSVVSMTRDEARTLLSLTDLLSDRQPVHVLYAQLILGPYLYRALTKVGVLNCEGSHVQIEPVKMGATGFELIDDVGKYRTSLVRTDKKLDPDWRRRIRSVIESDLAPNKKPAEIDPSRRWLIHLSETEAAMLLTVFLDSEGRVLHGAQFLTSQFAAQLRGLKYIDDGEDGPRFSVSLMQSTKFQVYEDMGLMYSRICVYGDKTPMKTRVGWRDTLEVVFRVFNRVSEKSKGKSESVRVAHCMRITTREALALKKLARMGAFTVVDLLRTLPPTLAWSLYEYGYLSGMYGDFSRMKLICTRLELCAYEPKKEECYYEIPESKHYTVHATWWYEHLVRQLVALGISDND